jgi:hypothetical protein
MGMMPGLVSGAVRLAGNAAVERTFYPRATVKCEGERIFRSQVARDVGCLLDVDPSVRSWVCAPGAVDVDGGHHVADFAIYHTDARPSFLDAPDRADGPSLETLRNAAASNGWDYDVLPEADLYSGFRLRNARDLLRYGNYTVTLGDRIRLLAALDEHGALGFAECLGAFSETKPVAGLSSLILSGLLEIDLDTALIGPSTMVRRIAV